MTPALAVEVVLEFFVVVEMAVAVAMGAVLVALDAGVALLSKRIPFDVATDRATWTGVGSVSVDAGVPFSSASASGFTGRDMARRVLLLLLLV